MHLNHFLDPLEKIQIRSHESFPLNSAILSPIALVDLHSPFFRITIRSLGWQLAIHENELILQSEKNEMHKSTDELQSINNVCNSRKQITNPITYCAIDITILFKKPPWFFPAFVKNVFFRFLQN